MSDKIYVISCRQDLASLGMDRMRSSVEGLEESNISLNWSKAKIVPVVASEKVNFEVGQTNLVPIRPIKVPAYAMVFQSFYGSNGMGDLACIGSTEMKLYSEDRVANMSMFSSRIRAAVLSDDLLGQVLIVPSKKA